MWGLLQTSSLPKKVLNAECCMGMVSTSASVWAIASWERIEYARGVDSLVFIFWGGANYPDRDRSS
jgi:hypothetical protein